MFNFLKKEKSPEYPEVVKEIHNEFFTAGDKILQQANELLSDLEKKDLEKGKRLAAIGFNKTREAIASVEAERKIVITKEVANLVCYYKVNYPNNKFITEEQVKEICEKYGLVCGEISMYKGFVPEIKLQIIERFKVKKNDIPIVQLIATKCKIDGFSETVIDENIGFLNKEDVVGSWALKGNSFYILTPEGVDNSYTKEGIANKYLGLWGYVKAVPFEGGFKICAPLKDMEIPSSKKVVGYKIQDIPDPVVLQPVKGGYLIVCAWGDEASDEIVVNETNN